MYGDWPDRYVHVVLLFIPAVNSRETVFLSYRIYPVELGVDEQEDDVLRHGTGYLFNFRSGQAENALDSTFCNNASTTVLLYPGMCLAVKEN